MPDLNINNSNVVTHELLPVPEIATDAEKWLNFAANHPGKLVLMVALSEAGIPLSKGQIDKEVRAHSDSDIPFKDGTIYGLGKTLTQTPGVRESQTIAIVSKHPREVRALEVTEAGIEEGTALAGLLLDWQIRNPELPLQKLLGNSSSKIATVQAPTLRMLMFADLVEQHENPKGPSINSLASDAPSKKNNTRQQAVSSLALEGVIEVKSQQVENEREFKILDAEYKRSSRGPRFENLKPETRIIYKALEAGKRIREAWTVDEFLRLADVLEDSVTEEQMKKIRTRLQQSLAPSRKEFSGVIEPVSGQLYEGMSMVKLKAQFLQPITELVQLFDGFVGGDPEVLKKGRNLARSIYSNPVTISWLLRYTHNVSSYTDYDQQKMQHILDIIGKQPETTTNDVLESYRTNQGRRIGNGAIRATIAEAKYKEVIISQSKKVSVTKDKKTPVHSLNGDSK